MAFGQRGLDGGLTLQQPVQRGVEFVLIDLAEAEHFAEARCGGGGGQRTGGGELGCRIEDPTDQQGEDEIAAAIAVGAEDTVEPDLVSGAECGGDVAVRQAAGDGEGVMLGGDDGAALEHAAQAFDVGGWPVGEIAQGALTDLAAFVGSSRAGEWPGVSSDSGQLRYTWRSMSTSDAGVQVPNIRLHGYDLEGFSRHCESFQQLHRKGSRKLGLMINQIASCSNYAMNL